MVNYSQQMQSGLLNKYGIKQINLNNNDISPVNRASRGNMGIQSTLNKNNSSFRFSNKDANNQSSRPSSTNNKNKQNLNSNNFVGNNRERSNNSVKENYNNANIMATIKRTPSSNSLVKSLTRNFSKPTVGNENMQHNQQMGFLNNMNRQTPKNYSSNSFDLKNGEIVRNSYTGINVVKKNNQKFISGNSNLNIKSPTLNR